MLAVHARAWSKPEGADRCSLCCGRCGTPARRHANGRDEWPSARHHRRRCLLARRKRRCARLTGGAAERAGCRLGPTSPRGPHQVLSPLIIATFVMAGSMFLKPSTSSPLRCRPIDPRVSPVRWWRYFSGFMGVSAGGRGSSYSRVRQAGCKSISCEARSRSRSSSVQNLVVRCFAAPTGSPGSAAGGGQRVEPARVRSP